MPASSIAGPGPSTLALQQAAVIMKLSARDVGAETTTTSTGDGGLTTSTKIGIALGLICFFALIMSWYIIARWRRRHPPPTDEEKMQQATLQRMMDNISNAPAKQRATDAADRERARAYRMSTSTVSTLTDNKGLDKQETYELAAPPKAYLSHEP